MVKVSGAKVMERLLSKSARKISERFIMQHYRQSLQGRA